ncbi:hypothetical protein, partial [Veillonella parvula]|uniref:hypothetical protein n=1 Tax=Veillonella parvula TaxID=29466 RepID=UPI00210A92F7
FAIYDHMALAIISITVTKSSGNMLFGLLVSKRITIYISAFVINIATTCEYISSDILLVFKSTPP